MLAHVSDALPAGTGPYGHVHLAGNLWEPVADRYHPRTYGDGEARTDPGGPAAADGPTVLRGGGFDTFSTNMRVANRMSSLVAGSQQGVRCARPTTTPNPDPVAPISTVRFSGTLTRADGRPLSGKAAYVTAFDPADADAAGAPRPGASPLAEVRLQPTGQPSLGFSLEVPAGAPVLLFASVDGGQAAPGRPASGSGGVGRVKAAVSTNEAQGNLSIVLDSLPGGGVPGAAPAQRGPPTGKAPGRRGGPPGAAKPPQRRP